MAQLVEALRCKPEGRGFDSRWYHWKFFIDIILPAALCPWGSTQPLTEMSTGNISWGVKVGLTILPPSCTDCLEIWEPQPTGTLKVCPGL